LLISRFVQKKYFYGNVGMSKIGGAPSTQRPKVFLLWEIPQNTHRNQKGVVYNAAHYTLWILLGTLHTLDPVIHIWVPLYILPQMCITGPKVFNGQHQNMRGHLQTHLGWASGL
jgi:hypothetical protein